MNHLIKSSSNLPRLFKPHLKLPSISSFLSKPTSNDHQITHKLTQITPFSTTKSNPINTIHPKDEPIDAGSSIRKPVSLWPGVYHSPVTNALWEARSKFLENGVIEVGGERKLEDGLVSKTPSQSRTCVEYKFSSDYVLREQYRNPWNEIRMGKLLEDLDALAGTISYKHCSNPGGMIRPILLVTASVDKILLKKPIRVDADLSLVGAVTWVGRSSMEMQLEVLQPPQGRVFVDLPALADRDSILIRDTCQQSSMICQPQQRNVHGRIFGGYLMRKASELAFSTAYTFAGASPRFVEVDHVDFVKPVDVGNFLRMKSCVLYTELQNPARPLINVEVVAHVTCPELRISEVSNKFYFTFTVCPEARTNGLKIRSVFPETEEEARRVIERMDAEHQHDN
uniref:HotDog ACOT-type domain-containing protein n=1 Tax=Chenopodium quinoa TaxID=63459 RepID=A0A803M5P1_CHEQI